ncbi:MAG: hypothetical protein AAFX06_14595 [Planctomycetota bacterium]
MSHGRVGHSIANVVCCLCFLVGTSVAAQPPITALAFAADGESLVAVSQAGIQRRAWPSLEVVREVEVTMPNLHCCAFSPDAKRLAIGGGYPSEEGVVKVYAWPTLDLLHSKTCHEDSVVGLAWQNDTTVLSASLDRTIQRIKLDSEGNDSQPLTGHSRGVTTVCPLPDGKTLVSGGEDQSLRVWDLEDDRVVRSLNQHTDVIHAAALRPTAVGLPMVATAAADRTIRFWQPTIGRMVRYARLPSEPLSIAWLNEQQLIAACSDGELRLVDSVEVVVTAEYESIDGWAYCVAVHPSDGSVAVAGSSGAIRRVELRP